MKPKIIIPQTILHKLQFIVDNCDLEVSGLGTVVFDRKENAYRVTSAILLDQEVGSAHTDLDDKAVAQALYDTRNDEGELAFWWHSHVNMATFWSGQDHATMEAIGKNGLCVAVVLNKKDEMRGAIVMSPQDMPAVKIDDVTIETEFQYDFDTDALKAEIKQKVRPKTYTQTAWQTSKTTILDTASNKTSYKTSFGEIPWPQSQQESVIDNLRTDNVERKFALDEWSRLEKHDRDRYANFEDFFEEYLWGEYNSFGRYHQYV